MYRALTLVLLLAGSLRAQRADTVWVSPRGPVRGIAQALALVKPGGHVIVRAGAYAEPLIVVNQPVEIAGQGLPTFDGQGTHGIIEIAADDVTVRGLRLTHIGASDIEDRAALRVRNVRACTIRDNVVENVFFGIYLAKAIGCRIEHNTLSASNATEMTSGNGIHLWSARDATIANNHVTGFRDGIYFEFVHGTSVRGNVSERNLRYGLHFMYSDDCEYTANLFRANGAGVAVMYTKRVTLVDNRFEDNWGASAYGLLLKEISDARLERNVFRRNTTGLVADGANRMIAEHNDFLENGWAVKLDASTVDGRIAHNNFIANTFDVASNSRDQSTTLSGNYWDDYRGYDLNHDGVGDVPFRPVRLFAVVVEKHEPSLILLRSAFVELLDAAERVLPVIVPSSLADAQPSMRRLQ
jgi:nitrous oxidase accessory protein